MNININWSFIIVCYVYSVLLSLSAVAASIMVTVNKKHLFAKLLFWLGLSALLHNYMLYSATKDDLILAPFLGLGLTLVAAAEPHQKYTVLRYCLASCVVLMLLFGGFSILPIYE